MNNILHVCLEYYLGVGGLTVFMNKLLNELANTGLQVSIVTPNYDFYAYAPDSIEVITSVTHMYDGMLHESQVLRVVKTLVGSKPVNHYLIQPSLNSPVNNIFLLGLATKIYENLPQSSLQERLEYFNGAVAALVRIFNSALPIFEIVHLHGWHTGIASCLIKEFECVRTGERLNKNPYTVSSLHLLNENEQGLVSDGSKFLQRIGLPQSFNIDKNSIRLVIFSLLYADVIHVLPANVLQALELNLPLFGLEKIFIKANFEGRLFSASLDKLLSCVLQIYSSAQYRPVLLPQDLRLPSNSTQAQAVSFCARDFAQVDYPSINVLHIAIEYGTASLGGLGSVATNMVDAQNKYCGVYNNKFTASIITPYYPELYASYSCFDYVSQVKHLYDNQQVVSNIYLAKQADNKHYMVEAVAGYKSFFEIDSVNGIYQDNYVSLFIQRIKYFSSAVAAYINNPVGTNHPQPQIIVLHDWSAALVPLLLRDLHHNLFIKSVFIVHVGNSDISSYSNIQLQGIGLKFTSRMQILKAIGLSIADRIVAVSPSFLKECMSFVSENPEVDALRKRFVVAHFNEQKVYAILNGFNFSNYCPLGKLIMEPSAISQCKTRLKTQLALMLGSSTSGWHIDPSLPVIFYLGRFSPEKGVETFAQVINVIKNRAIFFALGRGLTDSVRIVMQEHSKKTNNFFISSNEDDQKKFVTIMRACADFTFVPSHSESCCLVQLEGFASGALCINSSVGGLQDSVKPLIFSDMNNTSGNSFVYRDTSDGSYNPSLTDALNAALDLWLKLSVLQKNKIHLRIIEEAKDFDWLANNGAITKYLQLFEELLANKNLSSQSRAKLRAS